MDGNVVEILKGLARKRMEMSLIGRKRDDVYYRAIMVDISNLEHQYESLDLEPETKAIMDQILEMRDSAEMEQTCIAYFAGMEDCVIILEELGLLKE